MVSDPTISFTFPHDIVHPREGYPSFTHDKSPFVFKKIIRFLFLVHRAKPPYGFSFSGVRGAVS